jgi:hypothetical protein
MKRSTLLLSTAVAMLATGAAQAGTLYISNMQYEGAPNPSAARGTGFVILNDAQTSATVYATHNIATAGTSPLTLGHIHRAPAGVNGPVIFGFTPAPPVSPVGPLVWAIPNTELTALNNAGLYMQFHTQLNPAGEIRGQILRTSFANAATNDTQRLVANALDVSAGLDSDLDQVLMGRFAATVTSAVRAETLEDLSGRSLYTQARQAVEAMVSFDNSLFSHAEDVTMMDGEGISGFVAGGQVFGKRDTEEMTAGSKVSRPFIMAGVDMGFEGGAAGLAIGYADGNDEFRDGVGETGTRTTAVKAYIATRADGFMFAATGGYGWVKVDSMRAITSLGRTATSEHNGSVWSIGAKVSMPYELDGDSTLAPYGQLDYQTATIDAYQEAGAGSVGLVVPEHKEKQAAAELGLGFHAPLGADDAVGIRLSAGYRYLLEDGKSSIQTRFVGSPTTFTTLVRSPGMSGVHAGVHLTGRIYENMYLSAGYNGIISSRTSMHGLEARLTLKM